MNGKSGSPSLLLRFFDSFLHERSIRWLLALGMVILLGSSLVLVTAQWQHTTPIWKYAIFLGYTAATFASGTWAYHRLGLRRTGNGLLGLTVLLIPLLFLGLGWARDDVHASLDAAARAVLGTATLGFSIVAARQIFAHFLRGDQPTFLVGYLVLAVAGATLPWLPDAAQGWAALALWGAFSAGTMKVNRHVFWLTEMHRKPRILGFLPIALLGGQFLALALLFAAPHLGTDVLGVGCVLMAMPVLAAGDAVARVFQQRTGDLVRPLPWSVLAPLGAGLLLCAAGMCLAATGLVPPPHRGHALAVAAAITAGLMTLVARRTGKAAFVWAMLAALTIAYQFSPAFFLDVVLILARRGAELVHEPRLPFAFYGLTYLPLLAALMTASVWLSRRGQLFARPMRRYCIGLACLLLAASVMHAKAVFPVGLVMTLVFAIQVVMFNKRWLVAMAVLAWVLAAFGFPEFLSGVLQLALPDGFRIACLTAAAGSLLLAGRWLDPWLARLPMSDAEPRPESGWWSRAAAPLQLFSLAMTAGLACYWIATALLVAGPVSWHNAAVLAVMLLIQSWRWRVVPLVVFNWQALTAVVVIAGSGPLLAPDFHSAHLQTLAIPVAFAAALSVFLWQVLAHGIAGALGMVAQAHLGAMRLLAALALVVSLNADGLNTIEVLAPVGAFLGWILAEAVSACRDRAETRGWIAIALAAAAAGYLAWFHVFQLASGPGMFITLGVAVVLWLGKEIASRNTRLAPLARPFARTAFVLPAVVVALGVYRHFAYDHPEWLGAKSLALLLAGGFYFWRGVEERRKELLALAAAILNVALVLLWRELSLSDPQWFMIPIGVTVLAVLQLFKEEVPERYHDPIRYAGALVVLVSPVFHIASSWVHLVTLMIASVGVVLVAIGLRVRALMYAGTAFLLADLVATVVRGSVENVIVLWIAGLVLGTAVLALGAACERNRESLLQRMRMLAETLNQWD
jgi:hypothetical protein